MSQNKIERESHTYHPYLRFYKCLHGCSGYRYGYYQQDKTDANIGIGYINLLLALTRLWCITQCCFVVTPHVAVIVRIRSFFIICIGVLLISIKLLVNDRSKLARSLSP